MSASRRCNPFWNREGKDIAIVTRSGQTIEGVYLGPAAHGLHAIDVSTDVTEKVTVTTYVPFDMVDSVTITEVAPTPGYVPA